MPARPHLRPHHLGLALIGGLGLSPLAGAQDATVTSPAAPAETTLPTVRATATAEPTGKESVRATSTALGKGKQVLRDLPQSLTVVTERLLDDRNLDTLKDTLKTTSGVSFQAAEGGEEDIRLRGFSLQATGDIFIDGMRDPAFYERDSFNWDRLEVLRGSASMLFGRGSTGGAVNQVSKQPALMTQHEVAVTLGTAEHLRATADFNAALGDNAALRVNAMLTTSDGHGVGQDKRGLAPAVRWGIGTRHEFAVSLFHLRNDNGMHYGLPWLTPGPARGGNFLWPTPPRNYYGLASDHNATGTDQLNASHIHRLADGGELKTQARLARYLRDQRASAIRFADIDPATAGTQVPNADQFSDATVLTRGSNNKKMALRSGYLQSDYTGRAGWWGMGHSLAAGVDAAHERFDNFALAVPAGVSLTKPRTTVGTPDDGAAVDETRRVATVSRRFDARALGVYLQDLVQVAPAWKLLAGLRFDRFEGRYHALAAQGQPTSGNPPVPNPCFTPADTRFARRDSLWSRRLGVLFQPSATQSYHLSYGTSFNTSGDTYQYDVGTAATAPEASRNLELGGRIESHDGRLSTRAALFHSTKFNERNRDAESVNACNYVLSGKRHAAGLELDLAGRLTPRWELWGSYAFIPEARVDASSGAAGTEAVGARPGLTPRHSGSLWTTYKLDARWRVGGGLNARSGDRPVGLAATSPVVAPRFVTADLMAEYTLDALRFKLSVINVTDKHHADALYRGHYVPGKPRTLQLTVAHTFF